MDEKISSAPLPKCLLVDDLNENLVALKAILEDQMVQIFTAKSGTEALELLLTNDFALALLDVQMPDMDGFELAEIMRSTEKTKTIPIIFVTAAGPNAQRIFRGYEAGAVDFLQKPLAPQVVVSKVKIFIELFSQRAELEEKINKLKETEQGLQRALKSRDEFMSICSHELKTPLTSLKMQIQIVERLKSRQGDEVAFAPERMEKFLSQADRSLDRIVQLVEDMLDISRVATGRLSLNLERADISQLTKEVVERLSPIMEMTNSPVTYESLETYFTLIDKFRYEQVLTNLLNNAAKYAPGLPVKVTVERNKDCIEIKVIDEGTGILEKDQKRIFERFERAVAFQSVSGLGLGLYISKEIVELHNGSISVESTPKGGSSFKISLPQVSEALG